MDTSAARGRALLQKRRGWHTGAFGEPLLSRADVPKYMFLRLCGRSACARACAMRRCTHGSPFVVRVRWRRSVQKLADLEAMDISRLQLMILDMQPDAKQNTLLTLPEVRCDGSQDT